MRFQIAAPSYNSISGKFPPSTYTLIIDGYVNSMAFWSDLPEKRQSGPSVRPSVVMVIDERQPVTTVDGSLSRLR
ncbi:hypothetical protein M513_07376 [Trichuris suis]|uniref:Uncharacterized protein n=1 Tax=Trichuris suis TaxID=68888 RepID=A0A085M384_9BILA|nr:hypothetical protein M513_07376 [Trichuris suis]